MAASSATTARRVPAVEYSRPLTISGVDSRLNSGRGPRLSVLKRQRDFELAEVRRGDLIERGVARVPEVAAVGRPLACRRCRVAPGRCRWRFGVLSGQAWRGQDQGEGDKKAGLCAAGWPNHCDMKASFRSGLVTARLSSFPRKCKACENDGRCRARRDRSIPRVATRRGESAETQKHQPCVPCGDPVGLRGCENLRRTGQRSAPGVWRRRPMPILWSMAVKHQRARARSARSASGYKVIVRGADGLPRFKQVRDARRTARSSKA